MEIKILKPVKNRKWKKGDLVKVARNYGKKLIEAGYACVPGEYLEKMAEAKLKPKTKTKAEEKK